jgi:hypothetical protein
MVQADSVPTLNRAPITGAPSNSSTKRRSADRRYFIGGSDTRIIMGDDEPSSGSGAKSGGRSSQKTYRAISSSNLAR